VRRAKFAVRIWHPKLSLLSRRGSLTLAASGTESRLRSHISKNFNHLQSDACAARSSASYRMLSAAKFAFTLAIKAPIASTCERNQALPLFVPVVGTLQGRYLQNQARIS